VTLYLDSTINFGKYAGTKVRNLPKAYVSWLKQNTEHKIKDRPAPKVKEVTSTLTYYDLIKIEEKFRRMCTEIGRKLIYDNVQIPF